MTINIRSLITDQKTQNRLHADTGTALFSIRKRKEAVTRMLDILKETPEYLQVMNHIPAYDMDDDTSDGGIPKNRKIS